MRPIGRRSLTPCALVLLFVGWTTAARAQITFTVSGSPAPFTITSAVAGSQPTAKTNGVTTYFVKTRTSSGPQKITARLNSPMPAGTTLTITMVPPAGATSLGPVSLDATARKLPKLTLPKRPTSHPQTTKI